MLKWLIFALLAAAPASAQNAGSADEPLAKAYEALRRKSYEDAIALFQAAMEKTPERGAIHKDLAYTYLKIGETEAARDQFREAMRLDPGDHHVALEFAFLCYETREQAEARRIFDRIRKTGDAAAGATAEQAFQNIDIPLKEGIERWLKAIEMGSGHFSSHYELAGLAERRDELELAAVHYEKAWRLFPERKYVLVDLGRVWKAMGKGEQARAALLAASRGGEPRAAEKARELLPARYPYVYEFQRALELDSANIELRRELAYLLLKMNRQPEAEREFRIITEADEKDLLSAAQLGFLYLSRKDTAAAMPLLERVLRGKDEELANRVRAVLRLPQVLHKRSGDAQGPASADARMMAERSMKAGYMKDALKYLQIAHEEDPIDFSVMLKLGWTYNILRDDVNASRWFRLARKSPDPRISSEAARAQAALRPSLARFRTSAWLYPSFSSRWHDIFSYGQVKTEVRTPGAVRPYVSLRFIGDTKPAMGAASPQYLSESSFILAAGLRTEPWQGITLWGEAGSAISYRNGHMLPDYRGGAAFFHGYGHGLGSESAGTFSEIAADAVFVSRFNNDLLVYSQYRFGYRPDFGSLQVQFYGNANLTVDSRREYWANFIEGGPGVRFRAASMPSSLVFSVDYLRGSYTINRGNPRRPNFFDLRAGFWYAISR